MIISVAIPLALVIAKKIRMDVAALLIACLLGILQALGFSILGGQNAPQEAVKAITGFGQPVIITLIALFIMTSAFEKSGIPRWLAHRLLNLGRNRVSVYILLFTILSAGLSLFMNTLAAGALLLPGAMELARISNIKPSKLLIPLAYGTLLGGSATYFSTANIIISDLLKIADPPQVGLSILAFTPTGGLIAVAGILFLWLVGNRILPDRESSQEQNQARLTGSQLEDFYSLGDRLWEARILPHSSLNNISIRDSRIGLMWGVAVAAIHNGKGEYSLPYPDQVLTGRERILLVGREEKVLSLKELGLEISPVEEGVHLTPRGIRVVEIVLTPHSKLQGKTIKELIFRQRFGVSIVGIRRLNRSYRTDLGDMMLTFGDSLLVIGDEDQISRLKHYNDFILLEPNPADQPLNKRIGLITGLTLLAAIISSILGFPVYLSMLTGAVMIILLRATTIEEAYHSIHWQTIFLIGGMYSVSVAMIQTGLAEALGNSLIAATHPFGSLGLAAGAFLLSVFLTQIMGSQITALVTGPITIGAAITLGINPQAIAVATAIGCSTSFLTPFAHPVNIMVIGPGNYRFRDFARVGWLLTVISFIMLMIGMVVFWNLS